MRSLLRVATRAVSTSAAPAVRLRVPPQLTTASVASVSSSRGSNSSSSNGGARGSIAPQGSGRVEEREAAAFIAAVQSKLQIAATPATDSGASTLADTAAAASASVFGAQGQALLARLRQHKQPDLAWKVYLRLRESDGLTAADYNEFLHVLSFSTVGAQTQRTRLVEDDMRRAGVFDEADEFQASSVIRARTRANDFAGATAAFSAVQAAAKRRGRPLPDWVVLSYVAACARAADAPRALDLHREHFAALLRPPPPRASGRSGTSIARQAAHERALKSLAQVMNAFARRGEREAAERLLDDAIALGATPLPHHVNALLLACARASESATALRIFGERFGAAGAPSPDQHSYVLLLKACVFAGDMDRALEVREQATAAGLGFGAQTDLSVIRGFVDAGEVGSAWRVYEQMRTAHGVPNLTILTILTRACRTASRDAVDDAERALWMQRAVSLFGDGQQLIDARQAIDGQANGGDTEASDADLDDAAGHRRQPQLQRRRRSSARKSGHNR